MYGISKYFKRFIKLGVNDINTNEEIKIILIVPKGYHSPPQYHGYKGCFVNVNVCSVCSRTALYEDMHVTNPCPDCGGKIKEKEFAGIWDKKRKKWLKREEHFEKDIKEFLDKNK